MALAMKFMSFITAPSPNKKGEKDVVVFWNHILLFYFHPPILSGCLNQTGTVSDHIWHLQVDFLESIPINLCPLPLGLFEFARPTN